MYEYLKGIITTVTPGYIVIEVSGVGYKVQVANPYRYEETDQKMVTVYVYQAIRENDMTLFGFYNLDEKHLFEKLISVSGIGPKSALAILANEDHGGLVQAINLDDVSYLTKFPGVGKKTAQQIVLDLKGKLDAVITENQLPGQTAIPLVDADYSEALNDALAALAALGYSPREVKAITKKLATKNALTTDAYLREGLKLLMKK